MQLGRRRGGTRNYGGVACISTEPRGWNDSTEGEAFAVHLSSNLSIPYGPVSRVYQE